MSSFGCKQPLKHAILTTDKWFGSAEQMVCYLRKHFETLGDSSKEHYLVDEADTANIRRRKHGEPDVIKPCICYNIIAVHKFGNFTKIFDFKDIEPKKLDIGNECSAVE